MSEELCPTCGVAHSVTPANHHELLIWHRALVEQARQAVKDAQSRLEIAESGLGVIERHGGQLYPLMGTKGYERVAAEVNDGE